MFKKLLAAVLVLAIYPAHSQTGFLGIVVGPDSIAGGAGCGDCAVPDPDGLPGCSDADCEAIVCAIDPFCCATSWDSICADEALMLCVCRGCGNCDIPNPGVPGCSDPACEAVICIFAPFCCTSWDEVCAVFAVQFCDCGPCQSDVACDDLDPCNGQETCVDGECQPGPMPDCNGNTVHDACDIANGTSLDADGDGVPDECVVCQSDLDGDGEVGIVDFLKLLSDWGVCP